MPWLVPLRVRRGALFEDIALLDFMGEEGADAARWSASRTPWTRLFCREEDVLALLTARERSIVLACVLSVVVGVEEVCDTLRD